MTEKQFRIAVIAIACLFVVIFCALILPALAAQQWDIVGAFGAGFVNPFAAGYSLDVILCWCVLAVWVLYERRSLQIRYGWVCLLLGIIPGVALGFGLYLLLRSFQLQAERA